MSDREEKTGKNDNGKKKNSSNRNDYSCTADHGSSGNFYSEG